jgi:uncharacterized membrane protein YfcA
LIEIFNYQLSNTDLGIVMSVALLIGMAKTGVFGAGMLAVPLLATVFGGQKSTGVLLPLLIMADIMAVIYYHRHASWRHLKILFPWAALGVIIGTLIGGYMNDAIFKIVMAIIIGISVFILIWLEKLGAADKVPHQKSFGIVSGVAGGFTSMVGNLAGSVMNVYLLSMQLPKNIFIGTTAWFFLVLNWFKFPFHVFVWHTITWRTVKFDLIMLPVILIGAFLGIYLVKKLNETVYRWFIIIMTLVAAVGMLF